MNVVGGYMLTDGYRAGAELGELDGFGSWLKNVNKKYVEPLVQIAAPIAGGIVGGPAGAAVGSAAAGFLYPGGPPSSSGGARLTAAMRPQLPAAPGTPMTLAKARELVATYSGAGRRGIAKQAVAGLVRQAQAVIAQAEASAPAPAPPSPPPPPPPPPAAAQPRVVVLPSAAPAAAPATPSVNTQTIMIGAALLGAVLLLRRKS